MRGKKIINTNQIVQNSQYKAFQNNVNSKKRIVGVKSLEHKLKSSNIIVQPQKLFKSPLQNAINDYEIQREQRKTMAFIPTKQPQINRNFPIHNIQEVSRFKRNTGIPTICKSRQNHLINWDLDRSTQNSTQKIKLVSVESKQRPQSRSENSSTKKRGIQLTKTLLKRISGMYNDKDFQNKNSYVNKQSNQQITRITMSGREVYDQYQISDLDFQPPTNYTFNTSCNNHQSCNNSDQWNKLSIELSNTKNLERYAEQSKERRDQLITKTPKKQLMKIKSHDLINTQKIVDSIVVGQQPPPRAHLTRRGVGHNPHDSSRERYLIKSKNKTMDQMSLKQSMVIGFEHYQ